MNDKKVLISAYLIFIIGFEHLIIGILSLGILELSVTAFIFFFFYVLMGYSLIRVLKNNLIEENNSILLGCTTIAFLNSLTYFLLIITSAPADRTFLYYLLIIPIAINIFNFPILFLKKIELDQMTLDGKLSYFSIVIIRGLGFSFLFNILAFIGWPMNPIYPMIFYLSVFGLLNLLLSNALYNKISYKNIQLYAIAVLMAGMIIGIGIYFLYPNPKTIVWSMLYIIIIPLRFYYFNKNS